MTTSSDRPNIHRDIHKDLEKLNDIKKMLDTDMLSKQSTLAKIGTAVRGIFSRALNTKTKQAKMESLKKMLNIMQKFTTLSPSSQLKDMIEAYVDSTITVDSLDNSEFAQEWRALREISLKHFEMLIKNYLDVQQAQIESLKQGNISQSLSNEEYVGKATSTYQKINDVIMALSNKEMNYENWLEYKRAKAMSEELQEMITTTLQTSVIEAMRFSPSAGTTSADTESKTERDQKSFLNRPRPK